MLFVDFWVHKVGEHYVAGDIAVGFGYFVGQRDYSWEVGDEAAYESGRAVVVEAAVQGCYGEFWRGRRRAGSRRPLFFRRE